MSSARCAEHREEVASLQHKVELLAKLNIRIVSSIPNIDWNSVGVDEVSQWIQEIGPEFAHVFREATNTQDGDAVSPNVEKNNDAQPAEESAPTAAAEQSSKEEGIQAGEYSVPAENEEKAQQEPSHGGMVASDSCYTEYVDPQDPFNNGVIILKGTSGKRSGSSRSARSGKGLYSNTTFRRETREKYQNSINSHIQDRNHRISKSSRYSRFAVAPKFLDNAGQRIENEIFRNNMKNLAAYKDGMEQQIALLYNVPDEDFVRFQQDLLPYLQEAWEEDEKEARLREELEKPLAEEEDQQVVDEGVTGMAGLEYNSTHVEQYRQPQFSEQPVVHFAQAESTSSAWHQGMMQQQVIEDDQMDGVMHHSPQFEESPEQLLQFQHVDSNLDEEQNWLDDAAEEMDTSFDSPTPVSIPQPQPQPQPQPLGIQTQSRPESSSSKENRVPQQHGTESQPIPNPPPKPSLSDLKPTQPDLPTRPQVHPFPTSQVSPEVRTDSMATLHSLIEQCNEKLKAEPSPVCAPLLPKETTVFARVVEQGIVKEIEEKKKGCDMSAEEENVEYFNAFLEREEKYSDGVDAGTFAGLVGKFRGMEAGRMVRGG